MIEAKGLVEFRTKRGVAGLRRESELTEKRINYVFQLFQGLGVVPHERFGGLGGKFRFCSEEGGVKEKDSAATDVVILSFVRAGGSRSRPGVERVLT